LTNADVVSTGLDKIATNADVVLTGADVISSAASAAAAAASADAFDDVYLGSKASDPTTDNDGDPLAAGMLYYNTISSIMRIYSGSAWENVAVSTAGFATLAGVETFTNKTLTSPKINEDVVVTSTATELNILDGVTSTTAELNTLDGLSRGSILYGNASAATTVLTKGTVGQVLTSDGTDISWDDAFSGIAWQSVQTTGFTASAGNAYPCDTTSAAFTVTLPASASVGDQIQLVDYAGTFATNNITLGANGLKIESSTDNKVLTTNREGVTITYVDATQGWVASSGVNSGTQALDPAPYSVDFLVIAGGGGGGSGIDSQTEGGGGGAGGYRNSYLTETSGGGGSSEASLSFTVGTVYTITVGGGGAGGATSGSAPGNKGVQGTSSSISGTGITTITSTGGGGGGSYINAPTSGGSGGGGTQNPNGSASGTANQGFAGGAGSSSPRRGGGGGGASEVGNTDGNGHGGDGLASSITGSSVTRGGGGGGGGTITEPNGGDGGGGTGRDTATDQAGENATVNTGGGGGGANVDTTPFVGGNGGSGVVILRMPDANYSGTTTGSPTVATGVDGTDTVLTFNASGSYTA
jgi:hypothetical protein